MNILWTEADIIQFVDRDTSNTPIRRQGVKVGKWLVVGGSGETVRIFKLHDGKKFLDVQFSSLKDAVKLAKWLDKEYGEYFYIWQEYPDADVIAMAKWSIRDGIAVYETLARISGTVTAREIQLAYVGAKKYVSAWTRRHSG